ncbi:MAG: DUF1800 family protein [Gammaproteobacteria bacterium]|nr:DUF1800 family protein [Gammaproteobacteria bacterium]
MLSYLSKPMMLRLLIALVLISLPSTQAADSDSDGVANTLDNCTAFFNPDQRDTNADGYGNVCDLDFDNDLVVNFLDLNIMAERFSQSAPYADALGDDVDINGDGHINFLDVFYFNGAFLGSPGPSAVNNAFDAATAARFLNQATFGARWSEIEELTASGNMVTWIDNQIAIPASSHEMRTRTLAIQMCFHTTGSGIFDGLYENSRQTAFWEIAIDGADQLRQRVALALSEILVVSDRSDMLAASQIGIAHYYDTLASHAFGNYRDLLQAVTLHATMGIYLSMVRSEKPQPALNIRPDENYARELLQLFTLGPHLLNPDGSKVLDVTGNPVPAYTQDDIEELARVFTGWNYSGIDWHTWFGLSDRTLPLVAVEVYHDTDPKTLLGGLALPGGQTAAQDLDAALDNVFAHSNVGPHVSRLLIQRLVTSNPTPEYIQRVASTFDDNGAGVRGDLSAVIKAILLDVEAQHGHILRPTSFGKLREPLLRLAHMRRTFNAIPVTLSGQRWTGVPCGQAAYNVYPSPFGPLSVSINQQPQNAPSVFNFFSPDYSPSGPVRDAGLFAPEFQMFNTSLAQTTAKVVSFEIQNDGFWGPGWVALDVADEIALAANPELLVEHLNMLLMSGQMTAGLEAQILAYLNDAALPGDATRDNVRARDAIMLITSSPDYLIQK